MADGHRAVRTLLVHDGLPIMAAGLPAMAAWLEHHGYPAQVWNRYADFAHRGGGALARPLEGVEILGISVHWFYQLPSAMHLARTARDQGFGGFILLGGFTASLYAEDLLGRNLALDGVIRGDGEAPLLELVRQLSDGRSLDVVPNLVWRDGGTVRSNPFEYVGGPDELDALEFGGLDTICNLEHHLAASSWRAITDGSPGLPGDLGRTFYLEAGRGCSVDCATCGGGRTAHRLHSRREGFVFRSPTRLADDVERAAQLGCTSIHACFDPAPGGPHWFRFMDEVERRGIHTSMLFECFGLPSRPFLERFAQVFEGGGLILSPETADERIRRRTRGFPFTNDGLEETLTRIGELGLRAQVFFGYFAPLEGLRELRATQGWVRSLRRRFGDHTEVFHYPYSTDPASPLANNPRDYGMRCTVQSAADYERAMATQEPWLGNLLRHEPDLGEPGEWRVVSLAVELDAAVRRDLPRLAESLEEQLGDRLDAFFLKLGRKLVNESAPTLQRSHLADLVRLETEGAP